MHSGATGVVMEMMAEHLSSNATILTKLNTCSVRSMSLGVICVLSCSERTEIFTIYLVK